MARKKRNLADRDYIRGYAAGAKDPKVRAYYLGVGYGKRDAGQENVGFSHKDEHAAFERGIENHHNHYIVIRKKKKSLLDHIFALFGKKPEKKQSIPKNQNKVRR